MGTATITEWNQGAQPPGPVPGGVALTVDFDPKTLQLTYSPIGLAGGAVKPGAGSPTVNNAAAQQMAQSSTLALDLTFDTSLTGTSVQAKTDQLVALTEPLPAGVEPPPVRVVRFNWGTFLFTGMVQSLSQTIDFFSADGVPLRAQVHLALAQVKPPNPDAQRPPAAAPSSFGAGAGFGASASISAGANASAGLGASANAGAAIGVGTVPLTLSHAGDTVQSIAARAGGSLSWKTLAAANGIDNPRMVPPGTVLGTASLSADVRTN